MIYDTPEKLEKRRQQLQKRDDEKVLKRIKRIAKKEGSSKHGKAAYLADKHFGEGDYDNMSGDQRGSGDEE